VLAAPSGAGKTSLSRALLAGDERVKLSISVTTRGPRAGEVDGVHYHFIDVRAFNKMIERDELLEHASVFGRSYGTPRAPVEAALAAGQDVMFDIDWQGFRQVRAAMGRDLVGIFIRPPTLEDLHKRLVARGDAADEITRRMAQANAEMAHEAEFDYVVINEDFATALEDLRAIFRASRLASFRVLG
jgi:guanylate kinase